MTLCSILEVLLAKALKKHTEASAPLINELHPMQQAKIEHLSPDSVIDEARGLVFPARIQITDSKLRLGGSVPNHTSSEQLLNTSIISPGMSAAVEIKTGERTVLSFLLSPVSKGINEAGRER